MLKLTSCFTAGSSFFSAFRFAKAFSGPSVMPRAMPTRSSAAILVGPPETWPKRFDNVKSRSQRIGAIKVCFTAATFWSESKAACKTSLLLLALRSAVKQGDKRERDGRLPDSPPASWSKIMPQASATFTLVSLSFLPQFCWIVWMHFSNKFASFRLLKACCSREFRAIMSCSDCCSQMPPKREDNSCPEHLAPYWPRAKAALL
mmetsp:Transcript_10882/g.20561  ORF Transcript_10882/g.20561 Transcript_10882/m.20561 type:complete len:204 (-) Transcript_10882:1152-1763(-)